MKRVRDVMTYRVVVVQEETPYKEIVRLMQDRDVTGLPVVDADRAVVGVVSESDLVIKEEGPPGGRPRFAFGRISVDDEKARARTAAELMTAPAVTIGADATLAEAARTMHAHGLKRLPVVDEGGKIAGIVSQRDLLKVYLRSDEEIRDDIVHDVIEKKMWLAPNEGHVQVSVKGGVVTLEGHLERKTLIDVLRSLAYEVEGVVAIESHIGFGVDDTHMKPPPMVPEGVLPEALRWP